MEGEWESAAEELQAFVRESLPEHMVPSWIAARDELPLLPNGKVDRKALKKWAASGERDDPSGRERVAPRNEIEQRLVEICASVLGVETGEIGVHDPFHEIGGDSITSIHVVSRARAAGILVEPRDFLLRPTVAGLAESLNRA